MTQQQHTPGTFDGWSFISDSRNWRHFGEKIVVWHRSPIDSSYYDCLAPDGSSPAVSENHLREMFLAGKLTAPTD